jgi:hypothetical protein
LRWASKFWHLPTSSALLHSNHFGCGYCFPPTSDLLLPALLLSCCSFANQVCRAAANGVAAVISKYPDLLGEVRGLDLGPACPICILPLLLHPKCCCANILRLCFLRPHPHLRVPLHFWPACPAACAGLAAWPPCCTSAVPPLPAGGRCADVGADWWLQGGP